MSGSNDYPILPKVIQLVSGRAGIWTQAGWSPPVLVGAIVWSLQCTGGLGTGLFSLQLQHRGGRGAKVGLQAPSCHSLLPLRASAPQPGLRWLLPSLPGPQDPI